MRYSFRFIKAAFLFFLIFLHEICLGQSSPKQFVLENVLPVASIDASHTDYSDLEIIEKAIGNKRVVMLGELYHGDASAFQAKTRLIKFLHEKMGFNVLIFESDFFSLNHGWERLQKGKISFDSLVYLTVYPLWTQCAQFQPLISYISNQRGEKNVLTLSGMDNRGYTGYSMKHMHKGIDSFLRTANIPFVKDSVTYSEYYDLLKQGPLLVSGKNRQGLNRLMDFTQNILSQLHSQELNDSFYIKVLEGQLQFFTMAVHYTYDSLYKKTKKNYPLHDFQLAENLKWLVSSKYPNEKVIVWAHNLHIEKGSAINTKHNDYHTMGYYFTQDPAIAKQTYVLGFTAYSGSGRFAFDNSPFEKVRKPNANSIERWMHKVGYPYSFIDFSRLNQSNADVEPFYMKTYVFEEDRLKWNEFYDGVLFIDEMIPCEGIRWMR